MLELKSVTALAMGVLGVSLAPAVASAATLAPLTPGFDDSDFVDLIDSGQFTELFVAESRIGVDGSSDRELGINDRNGANVAAGEFDWINGAAYDFTLSYDGSNVTYTVDNVTLTSSVFSGSVTDIYLRTRATSNSAFILSDLELTDSEGVLAIGSLISSTLETSEDSDVDYLQVTDLTTPFTLTGVQTLSWEGDRPTRSSLASQVKVGTSAIPEPTSILGTLAFAALGGSELRRRQRK